MHRLVTAGCLALGAVLAVNVVIFVKNAEMGIVPWTYKPVAAAPAVAPVHPRHLLEPRTEVATPRSPLADYNIVSDANGNFVRIYRRDPNDMVIGVVGSNGSDVPMADR